MEKKRLEEQMRRDGFRKPKGKPRIPDRRPVKQKGEEEPGPPMPVPTRGPFIEERLAILEQKVDAIGKSQAIVMDIVRALGIKSKVLQLAEDGKSLTIVTPAPKKKKRGK